MYSLLPNTMIEGIKVQRHLSSRESEKPDERERTEKPNTDIQVAGVENKKSLRFAATI